MNEKQVDQKSGRKVPQQDTDQIRSCHGEAADSSCEPLQTEGSKDVEVWKKAEIKSQMGEAFCSVR